MNKPFAGILILLLILVSTPVKSQDLMSRLPAHSSYSIVVRNLKTGETLTSQNGEKAMISASLMKLVTTATALEQLGPGFQYSTRFYVSGPVENGILQGNLIIEGSGDPTLGSKYFEDNHPDIVIQQVAGFLRKEGITGITGKILIDENCFDPFRYPSKRLWEDMGNYYGAPPAGLSWRDNTFELMLQSPARVGEICKVTAVNPPQNNITFTSFVRSAAHNKDSAYIYGVPGQEEWQIRGSMPAARKSFTIKGALPHPGITFGNEVQDLFRRETKIPVERILHDSWKKQSRLIGEIKSPLLSEIIAETNQRSINLFADHLLLSLGLMKDDSLLSVWDRGLSEVDRFWKDKTANAYLGIADGSGLSPLNKLSSTFMVGMLEHLYQESPLFSEFKNSLSRNGHYGTLKYMWRHPSLQGKIYGKSGSMQDVLGYAGYFFPSGEEPFAFSIIINHHDLETKEAREVLEDYMTDLFLNTLIE
ncbi:D-alanyl-D-alanine carboxypeptidase/D-alanyl-D-alanine-endopeptidase [Marinilabilia salmonicolor]|jgi:D-alanyl-D-alanine carboxypeptidase/D-alanyl-D-alanine-endopeptidase (penicillin-binding protein 4)|uniref:D-alanyl-D-alanine carboxypeptidase/D-alanyl-D-alanine-endopeptidase (Penicillin-binding protein 4) n=1 Tax=Marinilabilia salmonicolor TaxID=989 RepID=A0A2T0XMK2_9BACT|nr:D-alanyl-D-alanine carboxypeptidase/D-alanyl-D-alanine-endopeptidase [Marinilabilia salmonicolor]PRZ00102.1 D-alanyl-D-alanine carboxypeptidase/D-alanyl-D-alanine-endopeptidase (penicillin-binding protein 4) [Marinilabilia salmonicolor]RCW38728.1 D-alanyl-D-alanine carboxypeptidase/D-alanyl-D-alanine-endopeptidase (penicillin-binding protein 4) [Marinilabilia salmonicolor]